MKVIAAINGSIAAESMAFYALKYAQVQKLPLVLLHIKNKKDDLDDVEASIRRITILAHCEEIEIERVFLQGSPKKAIKKFFSNTHADAVFCSTRKHKKFITDSFSEFLIKMNLNVDIAVVHIANINSIMDVNNITLSIKEDKLSVKKFTFFTTLAFAYEADGEIYSLSNISKQKLSTIDIHEVRKRFAVVNYNLKHYIKLANLVSLNIHIKHDFTCDEVNSVLVHVAKSNTDLVIVGARRLSVTTFFKKETLIEKLMRESSKNIIAYYTNEE